MKTLTRDEMLKMPYGTFYRFIDTSYEPDDYRNEACYGHSHFNIKCANQGDNRIWNCFELNEPADENEYQPNFSVDGHVSGGAYEVWDKEDLLTLKAYIDRALKVLEVVDREDDN